MPKIAEVVVDDLDNMPCQPAGFFMSAM